MSSKDPLVRDAVEMRLVFALLVLMAALIVQGCTAFNPQGAAIQQAPNYYNGEQYSQLSPEQKMQLEDHLVQPKQLCVANQRRRRVERRPARPGNGSSAVGHPFNPAVIG